MLHPMTTADLFNSILQELGEKNLIPNILDYALATHHPESIMTYAFNCRSNLDYGENEGIYLDCWIELFSEGKYRSFSLGTFKTLREDEESMHIMAQLMADFILIEHKFINDNLDDFSWTGTDVYILDDDGKKLWGYCYDDHETALLKKDKLLQKYSHISVRRNATREETIYEKISA